MPGQRELAEEQGCRQNGTRSAAGPGEGSVNHEVHICWAIQMKMNISVFDPSRRQQGIILNLMFLLYYTPCYSAAAIVLILRGLLEGRIICNDPDFLACL